MKVALAIMAFVAIVASLLWLWRAIGRHTRGTWEDPDISGMAGTPYVRITAADLPPAASPRGMLPGLLPPAAPAEDAPPPPAPPPRLPRRRRARHESSGMALMRATVLRRKF